VAARVTAGRGLGFARLMASAWRAADGPVHEHGVPAATAVKTPALAAVSWVPARAAGGGVGVGELGRIAARGRRVRWAVERLVAGAGMVAVQVTSPQPPDSRGSG
jgi:hypothetical protein